MIEKIMNIVRYGYTPKQLFNYLKYRIYSRKGKVVNYRPLWLLIYVTDLCNLHCKMCPHHTTADSTRFEQAKKLNHDFISLSTLKNVFTLFPESYFVMLAGVGEPLLHPKFKDIILLCEKHRKKVKLVTNGTRLNAEMAAFLAKHRCIDQIQISLNAPDAETYYEICQGNSEEFQTVVENIKCLVRAKRKYGSKMEIVTSAVCGNEYKKKASKFLLFADSLGVDRIELFRYIDFDIEGNNISDIKSDQIFLRKLAVFAKKNIRAAYSLPHAVTESSFKSMCDWFWKNLSIDSQGNIGSCGRVISPDRSYGNIYDGDDVWNNEYMQQMRELFLHAKQLPSKCCKACVENNREDRI